MEVGYGTKGSTRPEYYRPGSSIEVKNYNVETASGRSNLVRNITKQAETRASNLPDGAVQTVYIDVRGQQISRADLDKIVDRIVQGSNKTIQSDNIHFIR